MKEDLYNLWTTGRGLYILLGLLLIGIFISPIMDAAGYGSTIIFESIFALVLITGVFATPCRLSVRCFVLILAIAAVIARVLDKYFYTNSTIAHTNNILAAAALIAFSYLIVRHFLLGKPLLRYRITAAVTVYLIIGILWARFFEIVYLFDHAAFSHAPLTNYSLTYFSFVTLVTIGYGDIVPVSMVARSLAILEGVVGQLYLVILISSLVSEFSALHVKMDRERT